MAAELRRRGYATSMSEDPALDAKERRSIRVLGGDTVLDLYIRNKYWTIDKWIRIAGGWSHSIVSEVVQDRFRLRSGFTDMTAGTPHEMVLDTLVYNFCLPEPGLAPDPSA